MSWWAQRKRKKLTKQLLHDARFARNMRVDVADSNALSNLDTARSTLEALSLDAEEKSFVAAAEDLQKNVIAIMPTTNAPRLRENVEVAVVAIAVAMGIRTYFLQPFKIPTGSMQTTLYGITYEHQAHRKIFDFPPLNILKFIVTGNSYTEIKAPASGAVRVGSRFSDERVGVFPVSIAGKTMTISKDLQLLFKPNQMVQKGDVLAAGIKRRGDHILVNKIRYHFIRPKRGDIVVFRTDGIQHPKFSVDDVKTHYIKRLTGMPQETISVGSQSGRLLVDGSPAETPKHFQNWAYSVPRSQFTLKPPVLSNVKSSYYVPANSYLMMGDNTDNSFDGRYFGAVTEKNIVGEAFGVHWPFRRFGFKN